MEKPIVVKQPTVINGVPMPIGYVVGFDVGGEVEPLVGISGEEIQQLMDQRIVWPFGETLAQSEDDE